MEHVHKFYQAAKLSTSKSYIFCCGHRCFSNLSSGWFSSIVGIYFLNIFDSSVMVALNVPLVLNFS